MRSSSTPRSGSTSAASARSRSASRSIGNQTRVKVVKNKMAPPFKVVEFDIMYGEGISKRGELIDLGVQAGVVEKSGSWFSYDGQRIGQGRENAKAVPARTIPEIADAIERAIRANAGLVADAMMAAGSDTGRGRGIEAALRRRPSRKTDGALARPDHPPSPRRRDRPPVFPAHPVPARRPNLPEASPAVFTSGAAPRLECAACPRRRCPESPGLPLPPRLRPCNLAARAASG